MLAAAAYRTTGTQLQRPVSGPFRIGHVNLRYCYELEALAGLERLSRLDG